MNEAVREMTFEEEFEILQREKERVFASEKEGYEPPLANCVLRRALRCIDKLMKTSRREWYQKGYQDGLNADKWIPCEHCIDVEDHYKPQTNADRIRNMSDEELALVIMCPYDNLPGECTCEEDDSRANCIKCCLEWLQAEVKEC